MRTFIVTRHLGAIDWMRRRIATHNLCVLHHVDTQVFRPGDRVCGVLPLALAARICAAGAEAHVLSFEVPESLRGKELTAFTLDTLGAQLVRYDVRVVSPAPESTKTQRDTKTESQHHALRLVNNGTGGATGGDQDLDKA